MNLIKKYFKKNTLRDLLVFALFLALSIFYLGFYKHNIFMTMFSPSGDPDYYLFFLKWWPWAIIHRINPFTTNYLTYPRFYNTTWLTSIPTLSLIISPLTYYFGVVFSWNILCLMAPVTAAFSGYMLFRYLKLNYFASFIGGYIFGFSTYEMAQLHGHVFLIYIFPVPLIILLLLMRFDEKIGRMFFIICTSILMVLLLGISLEITTTFIIFLSLSIIIFILYNLRKKNILKRIYSLFEDIIIVGIITLILSFPFVYYLIIGLKNIHGPINSPTYYSADLLNFLIPTPITRFGRTIFQSIASHFTGNYAEESAYLGIGLFLITIFSMLEGREKKENWIKPFIIITAMLAIFSLGPYLHINGIITKIPLPWHLFDFKPFNNALPTRFTMYVFLCIAFWIGLWLDKKNIKGIFRLKRYIFLMLSLMMIIPNYSLYNWSRPNFNKMTIKKYIPKGSNILALPLSPYGQGALWVVGSNFKIYMTGPEWGYSNYKHPYQISDNAFPNYEKQIISAYCVKHDIHYIVLSLHQNSTWKSILNKVAFRHKSVGSIIIYYVPKKAFKNYINISYEKVISGALLSNFNKFYFSANRFLKNHPQNNLYPKYLENHGYIPNSYGFSAGSANNWTKNGGWIGRWSCPDGQGSCFGIGIIGNSKDILSIIKKYSSKAIQIFFPYPELYNPKVKAKGQLLMIFKKKIINRKAKS